MRSKEWASLICAVLIAGIGAILATNPADLALDPVVVRWLGIVNVMLGVIATQTGRVPVQRILGKR